MPDVQEKQCLTILLRICLSFEGLFTADQKLNGQSSIYTRQNQNGARRGYECPEERDYYPYWHPTDWIDIAVLAHNKTMCEYYQKESFNVKNKGKSVLERYGITILTLECWVPVQNTGCVLVFMMQLSEK